MYKSYNDPPLLAHYVAPYVGPQNEQVLYILRLFLPSNY